MLFRSAILSVSVAFNFRKPCSEDGMRRMACRTSLLPSITQRRRDHRAFAKLFFVQIDHCRADRLTVRQVD